ncbi:MAG: threonylcarbamoyl-AMP synthase [Candidatus Omnitrophica bacterium CG1_02_46_14]|nr:MAG: threonylcarbamoyl-AMP synthase [Candidatus Omnitrophica bacterium CG1_02_46_14]
MPANIVNANDASHIEKAVQILKDGGIVAFPTETVYGLGADAFNPSAVAKVFEVKNRPQFNPLIVHVASIQEASSLWQNTPLSAQRLMEKFWPGPLTLVLPKTQEVPDIVTSGLKTVGVRMPKNEIALKLIRLLGRPIAAPSANIFGYTSATNAFAVAEDFDDKVDMILDGGSTGVGIESTVVKVEKDHVVLLRPGGIDLEEIKKVAPVVPADGVLKKAHESPGEMVSHYAPWTNLSLIGTNFDDSITELRTLQNNFQQKKTPWPRIGVLLFGSRDLSKLEIGNPLFQVVEVLSPEKNLREAAANLFNCLRKLDKMTLDLLIAETLPEQGLGLAIMDRLEKASAGHVPFREFLDNIK